MLQAVEAIVERDGSVRLLEPMHPSQPVRAILTLLSPVTDTNEDEARKTALRQALNAAWGCVKQPKSMLEIDRDIALMREEWTREWE